MLVTIPYVSRLFFTQINTTTYNVRPRGQLT